MTLTEIFISLCRIDSESGNEEKISLYIQNFLLERSIAFETQKDHQIVARIASENSNAKTLLFCAHMDTVSPGKNIEPIISKDGKITSKGDTILGADNKASVANMLFLIDSIYKKEISAQHHLEFVFTVKEEIDDPGIYEMDLNGLRAEAGFIFDKANEPEMNAVVSVASSISDFTIEIKGKGAHAGTPERGINALEMMVEFVSQLRLGVPYPSSTLNIGLIEGGESTNTVPSRVSLAGDFRSEKPEYMKQIEDDFYAARTKVLENPQFEKANIDINIIIYCKGYTHNTESKSFKNLESLYQSLGYENLNALNVQMGSDASCFMNHVTNAIETFCLNDGCFNVHSVDEYTTIENLEKLQSIMRTIVVDW